VGLAVLAGIAAKIVNEAPWRGAVQHVPGWDIPIAPIAHATGAVAGLLCVAAVAVLGRHDNNKEQETAR
jgi:hypothetical protein